MATARGTVAVLTLAGSAVAETALDVGDTSLALPGVVRAALPAVAAPRLALAADAGYGYTESQQDEGAHHRLLGQLGIGLAPLDPLEFALRARLRHDRHPDDGMGTDSGTTSEVSLVARAGTLLGSGLRFGGDLSATFPGSEQLSESFTSPALDARLLLAWAEPSSVRLAAFAGYRLDFTEGAADERERYRAGDKLALGLSEFDALLLGLGAIVPLGRAEILAEMSGDLLVGSGAPELAQSPLRASAGARFALSDAAALEALGEMSLSSRPDLTPPAPLIPVEPRFSAQLGFRYRFWNGPEPKLPAPPAPAPKAEPLDKPLEKQPVLPVEPPPPVETGSLQVTVVEQSTGHPLSDASVEILVDGEKRPLEFVTGSTFKAEQVRVGRVELIVKAERLREWRREIELSEGEPLEIEVQMVPAASSGQIRGLIRGFDGKGLQARVSIEPGGHRIDSAADGSFQVDLVPGDYDVAVSVEGYRTQKLRAKVGEDGVVILNVDMVKEGSR